MGQLAIIKRHVSRDDVDVAWATYRALLLAQVDEPRLQDDGAHQLAIVNAKRTFQSKFDEWSRQ